MKEIIELLGDTISKSDSAKIPDFKIPTQNDSGWGIKEGTQVESKQLYTPDAAKVPDFNTSRNLDSYPADITESSIRKTDADGLPNINKSDKSDVTENGIIKIETRNQDLEGKEHPKTGVRFVRVQITLPSGIVIEGVFPVFDSKYDAQLPDELHKASDKEQFDESNKQLKEWVKNNPKEAKGKFTEEQLEDIDKGRTPEGYTWHHNEKPGKMQLVDTETHAKTGHTGGQKIWGGGSENR